MATSRASQVNPVLVSMSNEAQASHETEGTESMDTHSFAVTGRFSELDLLMKALDEQMGHKLSRQSFLPIAVHAILLDSGFVLIDPVLGLRNYWFHFPDMRRSLSPFSVCYSLPQLLKFDDDLGPDFTDHVVLKFQTLSRGFQIYGSLAKEGSGLYRVSESWFESSLYLLRAQCLKNETMFDYNDVKPYLKKDVMKFWKIVKDEIALPLLIDLSYATGLSLPSCFMSLLSDLKLKILELLPATDVAKLACVCSEMRLLVSNNDSLKRKVDEEAKNWHAYFGEQELRDWLGQRWNWENMFHSSRDSQVNPVQESLSNEAQVSHETEGTKSMDTHSFSVTERFSEPYLLMKVLGEQMGDNRSMHILLAIAVHAILLDSGFVLIDPVSGLQIDRFHFPDEWISPFSIFYSLPQLLRVGDDLGSHFTDHVVLKFQTLSHFFQVYGSLANGGSGSGLYRVSLDESRFAPTLDLLWAHCFENETMTDYNDGSTNPYPKTEVMKFWKIVKDELALPLLIDLSYTTGLSLPACLMSLPPYLKLKILELLPATDVAKLACVCTEMRYSTSNNDLWKKKIDEEVKDWFGSFGQQEVGDWLGQRRNWKKMFCLCRLRWKKQKEKKRRRSDEEEDFSDSSVDEM